ncbi:hypothetical protein B0T19DRAFT_67482 [Cercophora scortea]|uniref:Uncharacterized protein n=1 Tax=Cercophora scortea TaxID=314031 RepID=A0AAE0J674_9PEZI|nr:hypothetical protein B0T19DRAFT_67482 [Cercophora scortea]
MPEQLSVSQVLALAPDELARFVKQNLIDEDDSLCIENITGWEDMSKDEGSLLARKLRTAADQALAADSSVVGPVDPADLAARLAQIPSDGEGRARSTTHCPSRRSRSPTKSPPDPYMYQPRFYEALVSDGGRPLYPLGLLHQVSANVKAYRDLLRPWTEYPDSLGPDDWGVFYRQWDRWRSFRRWQHHRRRMMLSFSDFLDQDRREFTMFGTDLETWDSFDEITRKQWEREFGYILEAQRDGDQGFFSRYAEAARSLLADHEIDLPFQLHLDPKQQDQRTTFIEYLVFEFSHLTTIARRANKLQQRPEYTRRYLFTKSKADHQRLKVDWILSEIGKIEVEQKTAAAAAAANSESPVGARHKKRKTTDDDGDVEPPAEKRRRTDETETETEVAGDGGNSHATPRRILEVGGQSDGSNGARSRREQEEIGKQNDSAAPGSLQQSGLRAVAASADVSHSRTRLEPDRKRFDTLRPRAGGKAVVVPASET